MTRGYFLEKNASYPSQVFFSVIKGQDTKRDEYKENKPRIK